MPVDSAPWYAVNNVNEIDSPALLIYPDRVKHNIALAIEMVGNVNKLRPHVKTHKSSAVTKLMLKAGIGKFKCATVAEAEMLARCFAPDVLLAYQPTGPKIGRLLKLIEEFSNTQFSCLVDSIEAATAIANEAANCKRTIDVFIDVNVGMNRTGTSPQNAMELYNECKALAAVKVVGVHGYDGHINDSVTIVRKKRADEAFDKLNSVRMELQSAGLLDPVMVVGGSPTFSIHANRNNVECSPGTFVYWDWSYNSGFPDMGFLPAALVLSRVVSVVNENTVCLDLGHKSIAAENPLSRRVHWLNADGLTPLSQSEEHLVMESSSSNQYKVGDVLYGMPYHVCPTVALYDTAFVIEDHRMKEQWQTAARTRKISI